MNHENSNATGAMNVKSSGDVQNKTLSTFKKRFLSNSISFFLIAATLHFIV